MILAAIEQFFRAHWLELAGFITTGLGIWLTARRNLLCWPITLAADVLYLVVFYQAGCSPIHCCRSSLSRLRSMAGGTGGAAFARKAKSAWFRCAPAIWMLAIVAGAAGAMLLGLLRGALHAAFPTLMQR